MRNVIALDIECSGCVTYIYYRIKDILYKIYWVCYEYIKCRYGSED